MRAAVPQGGKVHRIVKIDIGEVTTRYFGRIHRAALVLTGNPWDADDLAQETFLVLARQADRYEGRSRIYTWLYGILLNLDRRRRRREAIRHRGLAVVADREGHGEASAGSSADLPAQVAEWRSSLWEHVAKLPEGQRHTIVLRFSEGLRYEEIAEVLGCPLGTVKSRIFHGLARLKALLEGDADALLEMWPESPAHDGPLQEDALMRRMRREARGG